MRWEIPGGQIAAVRSDSVSGATRTPPMACLPLPTGSPYVAEVWHRVPAFRDRCLGSSSPAAGQGASGNVSFVMAA